MTETSTVVTSTSEDDVVNRSSGSLITGARLKILAPDGSEITQHDRPGELYLQAPSVVLGYLNNEQATAETFVVHDDGRWIRTGDEGLVTVSPLGNEHVVIVDRIKELIKVKVGEIKRVQNHHRSKLPQIKLNTKSKLTKVDLHNRDTRSLRPNSRPTS